MQHSHQTYSSYSSMTDGGAGQQSTSPLGLGLNASGTGSHYYHRVGIGVPQQSPVYNSLISSQGQSLYNGVYSSQSGFPNQNNFSPANFNSCIETPVWFSDTRVSVSSNNSTTENDRISRNQYIDKNLSCCGSRIGVLENIGMCSPLSSETFKLTSKDFSNHPPKNANVIDSPNWLCSQGMTGYGNQQNLQHSSQQSSSYKCNEQFSSCSVSQINVLLPEQNDLKLASNVHLENFCTFSLAQNQVSANNTVNKHTINHNCESDATTLKSGYTSKEHTLSSKYSCSLQKQEDGQSVMLSSGHSKQAQEQSNYGNITTMYTATNTDTNIHEYAMYTQAPVITNINDTIQSTRKHLGISSHQNNHTITGQLPIFQQHFHDPGVACDANTMESCFQLDSKSTKHIDNLQNSNVVNNRSCCTMSTDCDQQMFSNGSSPYTQRQSAHCLSESGMPPGNLQHSTNDRSQHDCDHKRSNGQTSCKNTNGIPHIKLDCKDVGYKENASTNEGSSIAGESDIIVEETEEETESEISIEENKIDHSIRCLVCNASAIMHNSKTVLNNTFIPISSDMPTTTSRIPVAKKISQVITSDMSLLDRVHDTSGYICKICLNMTDSIDTMEIKLASLKQDLIQRYCRRGLGVSVATNNMDTTKFTTLPKGDMSVKFANEITKITQLECVVAGIDESIRPTISNKEPLGLVETSNVGLSSCDRIDNVSNDNVSETLGVLQETTCRKKYQCLVCSKNFASKEYLGKHQQTHTKEYSFYCEHCGQGFMLRRILDNHLLVHKGEFKYQCEMCGKLFIQRFNLDTHLRKHNDDYRVSCAQCGKGFMSRTSLQIHLRTHSQERPFVCQHCGRSFGTGSNLDAHIRVCSGDASFNCDKCVKRCSSKSQLRKHILWHHEGSYRSKCSVCGKGFMKDSDRKAHMVSHTMEKNHKCSVCGKCYTSLGNLNQHARKHDKERPFKCTVCGQGFLRRGAYTSHVNQHSGARPFSCDQCDKTFTSQRNLQAHRKWHAGTLKSYTCTVCGKTVRHGLEVHMRTHSGLKPYKCLKCDMAFTVRSTLNKHMKLKHECEPL